MLIVRVFYYLSWPQQSKSRGVSARALRDVVVIERGKQIHRDNYSVYGIRKM